MNASSFLLLFPICLFTLCFPISESKFGEEVNVDGSTEWFEEESDESRNALQGHNPAQNKVISEESAERILIKVLRQSGFHTDEEISEALAILRPHKRNEETRNSNEKFKRRKKRDGMDKDEDDDDNEGGRTVGMTRIDESDERGKTWLMVVEPKPRSNGTMESTAETENGDDDEGEWGNGSKRRKKRKKRSADSTKEEEWKRLNFTFVPEKESDGPSMVPKPWW